jgi:hypothetical protein
LAQEGEGTFYEKRLGWIASERTARTYVEQTFLDFFNNSGHIPLSLENRHLVEGIVVLFGQGGIPGQGISPRAAVSAREEEVESFAHDLRAVFGRK